MASLSIDPVVCDLCGACITACPFQALDLIDGKIQVSAACKMCGLCLKKCPRQAITVVKKEILVEKTDWQGILVYAEYFEGALHPVTFELIGIGKKLADEVHMPVYCLLIGSQVGDVPDRLLHYGVDTVYVYDDESLRHFRVDLYANVFTDLIRALQPSVVLVGGTSIGRSLAPRVATRFKTGLTADCTTLKIRENTDLVQIRPAFGGNIMAQIVTPYTRPQFATVRYKVMERAPLCQPFGRIIRRQVTGQMQQTKLEVLEVTEKASVPSITEANVLVVAGQGVKEKKDLCMIRQLAELLGGEYAVTRPLVEKGWADYTRQIGLSGRTVKPGLIITCGVSGAIQFTACMQAADHIVAINIDPQAPILKIAHYAVIDDLYHVVPALIASIKGAGTHDV